jgi:hypothetical protein
MGSDVITLIAIPAALAAILAHHEYEMRKIRKDRRT